jgi:hypothetical protein
MDKLIIKTKNYFDFENNKIKYLIKEYNDCIKVININKNMKCYYWNILMNNIYNYIYYYYINDEESNFYIYSSLFKKVNKTLYQKIFVDEILSKNEKITTNLIKMRLKDYIQEIIFSRIFINEIISNFINESNININEKNIKNYIKKIEKEYFNRKDPTYTKYNKILNKFSRVI